MLEEVFDHHMDVLCSLKFRDLLSRNLQRSGTEIDPDKELRMVLDWTRCSGEGLSYWNGKQRQGDLHVKYQFMRGNNGHSTVPYEFTEHTGRFLARRRKRGWGRRGILYLSSSTDGAIPVPDIANDKARERARIIVDYGIALLTQSF